MPPQDLSHDAALVARVQRDPESRDAHAAFREIVEQVQGSIFAQIGRWVRERERAEELLQETFLKAFKGLPGFECRVPLRAWIGRIARNLCVDEVRRQRRTQEVHSQATESGSGLVDRLEGPIAPPAQQLSEAEDRALVRAAVDRLPPIYAEIIHLRVHEGLPYAVVAELVGCRVGAAKQRMHKAMKLLGDELRKSADL